MIARGNEEELHPERRRGRFGRRETIAIRAAATRNSPHCGSIQLTGAAGRSDGGLVFAVLLLQNSTLRRRETRAEQGVVPAFAADSLQKQQTEPASDGELALALGFSRRGSTSPAARMTKISCYGCQFTEEIEAAAPVELAEQRQASRCPAGRERERIPAEES